MDWGTVMFTIFQITIETHLSTDMECQSLVFWHWSREVILDQRFMNVPWDILKLSPFLIILCPKHKLLLPPRTQNINGL